MFLSLLGVTFIVAFVVCFIVSRIFSGPIDSILERIVTKDISYAWAKYLKFAIYVVGISGGVRIYALENYLREPTENFTPPALTTDRWVLEIYRTIVESLQSIAWMLLVFFVFALIAYVIVVALKHRSNQLDDK